MNIPIGAIAGGMNIAGGIASIFGGMQQRRDLNNLTNYAHGASNTVLDFINGNTLSPGQASSGYFSTFDPLFGYANSIVNPATGDFFNQGMANMFGQIQGYGNNILPGLMSPQNPMMDPMMQQLLPWYDQMAGNANYGMDSAFNNLNSFGWNPGGQGIYDYAMNNAQGNPYNQNMMDIGSWYMQNGGQNPYNQGALDQALYGIRQGGYTPQIQGNLDFFGQNARNPYTQSIMRGQQMGQNVMGQGSGLINSAMGGMQQQFGMDPEAFLGQRGRGVLDSLAASPYIGGSYNTVQNLLGQGTANYGMTPYGQANWQQAMPRAYGSVDNSNAQMNDAWGLAMNRAGGNQDALPAWFGEFLQNAPGLFGNAGGYAGGGGGGASAGVMSRDLGPVDPQVQAALEQALEIFNKDPLLPMNQVVSMARDSAATAAKNQADAIARKAANLGGQGAIGAGVRNQAYADFADQALEGEATAIREAMLGQQGLQLNRAGQGAALAQAMQAAKSQREGLFGQMNIADAGNQTQASIANSNSADAAAARSLGAAQLQASIYNNLLNNATGLRGQNVEQQIAALNTLPGMQNAMTQRQGLLFDQMNQASNQANQRYLGTLGITGQLNDIANTDINRWNTMLQPLVAGQNTGTARGGQYGNLAGVGANLIGTGAGLYGNMENNASQNYGTSANAISNLINSANNNLGQYANIFGLGDNSQMNRLTFGGNMTNAGIGNTLNFANLANNANNSSLNFGINSGQLGNSLLNTQGNIWNNAMNNYLGVGGLNNATNANTANIFGQYAGMMNNAWSPFQAGVNSATGVMSGLNNGLLKYMGGAMSLMPSYMQGATFNPYGPGGPPNMLSGLGGFLQQNAQGIGQAVNGIGGLFGGGGFQVGGASSGNPLAQYGIGVFDMPGRP